MPETVLGELSDSDLSSFVLIEQNVPLGRDCITEQLARPPCFRVEVFILDLQNRTWSDRAVVRIKSLESLYNFLHFLERESDRHRVGITKSIISALVSYAAFQNRQHQPRSGGDPRCQWRKIEFTWSFDRLC